MIHWEGQTVLAELRLVSLSVPSQICCNWWRIVLIVYHDLNKVPALITTPFIWRFFQRNSERWVSNTRYRWISRLCSLKFLYSEWLALSQNIYFMFLEPTSTLNQTRSCNPTTPSTTPRKCVCIFKLLCVP